MPICPFCHCNEADEIKTGVYLCLGCKKSYTDDDLDAIKIAEDTDELTERIIEIFGQEIYWQQLMDDEAEQLNVLGRLRVRIKGELDAFQG